MGADVQFLEGALGFGGGDVEGVVGGEPQSLHAHAQPCEKSQISAQNFSESIRLGGGELIGVHQWRVYSVNCVREGRKKEDLRVEQQTWRFSAD